MPTDVLRDQLQRALAARYDIDREIGRGGMATVYLARDIKHDRKVALKLLNPELGAVLGGDRFLSEIRVTANLHHPNLLPLFDSGEADGLLFYVMPYVEGESLRDRLNREKQLPVDEAVRMAAAIASALDYAHRHGVIHRDLKPENVLLHDDQPLVADFGIALAVSNAGGARVTQTGLSLGTPLYMSPEQATGDRSIDGRTDIYSLGAVTYEMLAGEPPHYAASSQAIIARLMTETPRPLTTVRRTVPPHVDAAVQRALEKLPADRFATGKEFADCLQGRGPAITLAAQTPVGRASARARMLPWAIAGLATAAAVVALVVPRRGNGPPAAPVRFRLEPPPGLAFNTNAAGFTFAITRDGQTLAFLAGGDRRLFVRKLGQLDATPISLADNVQDMRFSPDGHWLGYKGGTTISKVAVDGSERQPAKLIDLRGWTGLTWTHGPDIVYSAGDTLWRITGEGSSRPFAHLDTAVDRNWNDPILMPDGKTISLRILPRAGGGTSPSVNGRIGFLSFDGSVRTLTDLDGQNVIGYQDGVLIYGRTGGRIAAVRFDLGRRKASGEPVTILDNVSYKPTSGVQAVLSDDGTLAYFTGTLLNRADIVDERGVVIASLPTDRSYSQPSWSPDGQRLAVLDREPGGAKGDVWIYDLRSRLMTRLTESLAAHSPEWTPDGKRIGFVSKGRASWIPADGSSPAEEIPGAASVGRPSTRVNFTRDGRYAIVQAGARYNRATNAYDSLPQVFALPLAVKAPLSALLHLTVPVYAARVSPNGKWLAYSAGDATRSEIFVTPFPGGGGRLQLTSSVASDVRWSRDGTKLVYRSLRGIDVATLDVSGAMPRVIRSDSLIADPASLMPVTSAFDLAPDGKRMALIRNVGEGTRLIVVTNWMSEVRAKLGMPSSR